MDNKIFKIKWFGDARKKLTELGATWDRTCVIQKRLPSYGRYGQTVSDKVERIDVHIYFMQGDCDIAYFTPNMETLFIHDKPRTWAKSFLDELINY